MIVKYRDRSDLRHAGLHGRFESGVSYIDGENTGQANIDGDLLGKMDMIVTTAGNVNVCDNMLEAVKAGAIICNIGHFDNEIDRQYMRDNWAWEEVKPQMLKSTRATVRTRPDPAVGRPPDKSG